MQKGGNRTTSGMNSEKHHFVWKWVPPSVGLWTDWTWAGSPWLQSRRWSLSLWPAQRYVLLNGWNSHSCCVCGCVKNRNLSLLALVDWGCCSTFCWLSSLFRERNRHRILDINSPLIQWFISFFPTFLETSKQNLLLKD